MSGGPSQSSPVVTDEYKSNCIEFARVERNFPDEVKSTYFRDLRDAVVVGWDNG